MLVGVINETRSAQGQPTAVVGFSDKCAQGCVYSVFFSGHARLLHGCVDQFVIQNDVGSGIHGLYTFNVYESFTHSSAFVNQPKEPEMHTAPTGHVGNPRRGVYRGRGGVILFFLDLTYIK